MHNRSKSSRSERNSCESRFPQSTASTNEKQAMDTSVTLTSQQPLLAAAADDEPGSTAGNGGPDIKAV